MTLCSQQNSLCFIPVFQSSNMRIKVLSESLHITARKTTFSLTATFTLIFSQTWVRRGLPRNYKGIKFFLSCSKIGVVYLIYLLSQGQWISIFPIMLQFISKQSEVVFLASFFSILESLHGYRIVLNQSSIGCEAYQRGLLTSHSHSTSPNINNGR